MKIPISEESKHLLVKIYSMVLSCSKEDLVTLQKVLSLTTRFELSNGLFLLDRLINNFCIINKKLQTMIKLSEPMLVDSFNTAVHSLIKRPEVDIALLTDERLNLDIPQQYERAQDILLTDILELYKDMEENAVAVDEIVPTAASLVHSLTTDATEYFIRQQAVCLSEPIKFGRKTYSGIDGAIQIAAIMSSVISELKSENIQLDTIDSKDSEEKVKGTVEYTKLFNTGLKPLDNMGGIVSNQIYSLIAYPEVGKTRFVTYLADMAAAQGVRAAVYQEESPNAKIISLIKSHAFYRRHNKVVDWTEFNNPSLIKDSDELKTEVAIFDSAYYQTEGPITLLNDLTLSNFRDRIIDHYNKGVKFFLLDGIASMSPGTVYIPNYGTVQGTKTVIDNLMLQMKNLKREFPLTFFIANWANTEELNSKSNNSTGSSAIMQYSDVSLEMVKVPALSQTLRAIKINKWREAAGSGKQFLIDTLLACCHFEYDEDLQHLLQNDKLKEKF